MVLSTSSVSPLTDEMPLSPQSIPVETQRRNQSFKSGVLRDAESHSHNHTIRIELTCGRMTGAPLLASARATNLTNPEGQPQPQLPNGPSR